MNKISDFNQTKIKMISLANEIKDDLQGKTNEEFLKTVNRLIDMTLPLTHKPSHGGKGYDDVYDEFEKLKQKIEEEEKRQKNKKQKNIANKLDELVMEIKHTTEFIK